MKQSVEHIAYLPKHSMSKKTSYGTTFGTVEVEEVGNIVCLHVPQFRLTKESYLYLFQLLGVILEDLRGKYKSILELIPNSNTTAIKLAKRMGFVEIAQEDGYTLLEKDISWQQHH